MKDSDSMNSPVQSRYLQEQRKLEVEVSNLLIRKKILLKPFEQFAVNKLKSEGKIFEFRFQTINDDENLDFQDLNIDDEATIVTYNFKFNSKTGMIDDYLKLECSGKKQSDDVDDFMKGLSSYNKFTSPESISLSKMPKYEQNKITQYLQKRIDEIVDGILTGELKIDVPKDFMVTLDAIEQELSRIIPRLEVLKGVNDSYIEELDPNEIKEKERIEKALEHAEKFLNGTLEEPGEIPKVI